MSYHTGMNTPLQPIAIFLRGINVSGIRIAMADLQACIAAAGYTTVSTVLATGNVVCTPTVDQSLDQHTIHIEQALSARFGYRASVHLRTRSQLQVLCTNAANVTVAPTQHCYLVIGHDVTTVMALDREFRALPPDPTERFIPHGSDGIWLVTKGNTLTSPFGKTVLGNKRYTLLVTTRTRDTMNKTLQIALRG